MFGGQQKHAHQRTDCDVVSIVLPCRLFWIGQRQQMVCVPLCEHDFNPHGRFVRAVMRDRIDVGMSPVNPKVEL